MVSNLNTFVYSAKTAKIRLRISFFQTHKHNTITNYRAKHINAENSRTALSHALKEQADLYFYKFLYIILLYLFLFSWGTYYLSTDCNLNLWDVSSKFRIIIVSVTDLHIVYHTFQAYLLPTSAPNLITVHIVTCRVVRVTKITGSISDDSIY
jgi:hypothetical protein